MLYEVITPLAPKEYHDLWKRYMEEEWPVYALLRNLLQGRLPVLGAANEYRAARALARAGVDTLSVATYACSGANPATRCSLLVTERNNFV